MLQTSPAEDQTCLFDQQCLTKTSMGRPTEDVGLVCGIVVGCGSEVWEKTIQHTTFHLRLCPPPEFATSGYTLSARAKFFVMNESMEVCGPFIFPSYTGRCITLPEVVNLQRLHAHDVAVLLRDEYASVFSCDAPVEPKAPVALSAAQTSHLSLLLERKIRAIPLSHVPRRTDQSRASSNKSTPQHISRPLSRPPSAPRVAAPSPSQLPAFIVSNPLAVRSTSGSATQLLAELCVSSCSPPVKPIEGGHVQDGMFVQSITMPPFTTVFATRSDGPVSAFAAGATLEEATEKAAALLVHKIVSSGIIPSLQFGDTSDETAGQLGLMSHELALLRKHNNTLQEAVGELQRQVHMNMMAKEQLSIKTFQQQELVIRQQQLLQEAYDQLAQLKSKGNVHVRRYTPEQLLSLRDAAPALPAGVNTNCLPFISNSIEKEPCEGNSTIGASITAVQTSKPPSRGLRDITNSSNGSMTNSSSSINKPITPAQVMDSACSTHQAIADKENSNTSPDRWVKRCPGKYAAGYVEVAEASSAARPARSA